MTLPLQAPAIEQGVHLANNQLLQHAVVSTEEPSEGDILIWDGSAWVPGGQEAWTTFTPTLDGNVTDPTLGSGGQLSGWWAKLTNRAIALRYNVRFGTAGIAAGSGHYLIGFPFAVNSFAGASGYSYDDSAGNVYPCIAQILNPNQFVLYSTAGTPASLVDENSPIVWAVNDYIFIGGGIAEAAS